MGGPVKYLRRVKLTLESALGDDELFQPHVVEMLRHHADSIEAHQCLLYGAHSIHGHGVVKWEADSLVGEIEGPPERQLSPEDLRDIRASLWTFDEIRAKHRREAAAEWDSIAAAAVVEHATNIFPVSYACVHTKRRIADQHFQEKVLYAERDGEESVARMCGAVALLMTFLFTAGMALNGNVPGFLFGIVAHVVMLLIWSAGTREYAEQLAADAEWDALIA